MRAVGHATPRRVADVAVGQRAVEVTRHHRAGAVRADHRVGVSACVASDNVTRTPSAVATSSRADRARGARCRRPARRRAPMLNADRRITTSGSPSALTSRCGDGCRSQVPSRQRSAPAVTLPPASRTASPRPISSSAASALGQMLMPAPDEVSVRSSMTVTSWPRLLQCDGGRQPGDARPDHQDPLAASVERSATAWRSYRSKISSVLVAVATTAPLASVTTPSANPTLDPTSPPCRSR